MLIFTILLIFVELYELIMGSPYYKIRKELAQVRIDLVDKKPIDSVVGVKILLTLLWAILVYVVYFVYLAYAYPIDILKYPTLILIIYTIGTFFYSIIKSNTGYSKDTEVQRAEMVMEMQKIKKRTLWRATQNIVWIGYFGYMLWILVGGTI